jgi:hypothetical protein
MQKQAAMVSQNTQKTTCDGLWKSRRGGYASALKNQSRISLQPIVATSR